MTQFDNNLVATFATELAAAVTDAVEHTAGQTGGLGAAITYLWQEPDIGIEQLRLALQLSQPATVRLVNQLVAAGLANRVGHDQDGRRVSIRLTTAGSARARAILRRRDAAVEEFLAGLSPTERGQLTGLITRSYERRVVSHDDAEHVCRLCDTRSCPPSRCPVEAARPAGA